MVFGTSSFFYFFQMLNNWPRLLMLIWESSHGLGIREVSIELYRQSSTLELHHNRLINSVDDFEQFYGLVVVSACNLSLDDGNATFHWQHYFGDRLIQSIKSERCFTTLLCAEDGIHRVQLSILSANGEIVGIGSLTFDVRPLWIAVIGDSFASGEGNPDVPEHDGGRGPDVVILTTGGNDIGFSDIINAVVHENSKFDISLMDMRQVCIRVLFFFVSHQLDLVAGRLAALGAGSVFVPQYFDFTKNQSRQESLSMQGNAMGAFHPNEDGHRAVAKEILKLLRQSGILERF
ncbi:unnamed protein product [Nippostrongylus brasiliensis]|uniref:SGNH_hydro domain-containing protein n=1 Tax=Nippostrongylus brasiliensis TaxID=27835 RepID=A0A0N4YBZ2_NIPBR|nr:unnamed protein product [Nippostrongylus brasiliensis]